MTNVNSSANINILEHINIKDCKTNRSILQKKEGSTNLINTGINVKGFVKIFDTDSGEILLEKNNAVNFENMSVAIARSLSSISTGNLYSMAFGNGGTIVDSTGNISYMTPNVTGINATLYNQTYIKTNITGISETYDAQNNVEINHIGGTTYSDIIITVTLGYDEPSDQNAFDNNSGTDKYTFSEIGLLSQDNKLLTHVIFSPLAKSLNRIITIEYTLRISLL